MNKLGIFINFWENSWDVDHIKYMKKAKDIGFDILEFQAQPLLEMTNEHMDEMKKAAADLGIELTYSLGLDPYYDISSRDPDECDPYWYGSTVIIWDDFVYFVDEEDMTVDQISDGYCWFKARHMKYRIIPD